MATPAELARLRDMVNEPDDAGGWTDEDLDAIILATANKDGSTNLRAAAAAVWEAKAAKWVTLTDVTESGSSRRNSQAFEHARKMADTFGATAPDPSLVASTRPRSTRMTRATRD